MKTTTFSAFDLCIYLGVKNTQLKNSKILHYTFLPFRFAAYCDQYASKTQIKLTKNQMFS